MKLNIWLRLVQSGAALMSGQLSFWSFSFTSQLDMEITHHINIDNVLLLTN